MSAGLSTCSSLAGHLLSHARGQNEGRKLTSTAPIRHSRGFGVTVARGKGGMGLSKGEVRVNESGDEWVGLR